METKQAKGGKVRRGPREADTTTSMMDMLRSCMFLLCDPGLLTFDFLPCRLPTSSGFCLELGHLSFRFLVFLTQDFGSYPAASLSCLCRPFACLLVGWDGGSLIILSS